MTEYKYTRQYRCVYTYVGVYVCMCVCVYMYMYSACLHACMYTIHKLSIIGVIISADRKRKEPSISHNIAEEEHRS